MWSLVVELFLLYLVLVSILNSLKNENESRNADMRNNKHTGEKHKDLFRLGIRIGDLRITMDAFYPRSLRCDILFQGM